MKSQSAILVLVGLLASSCNDPWVGKKFYSRDEFGSETDTFEVKLQGAACIAVTKDQFGRDTDTTVRPLPFKYCAPFIIAAEVKESLGACKPQELTLQEQTLDEDQFGREVDYKKLLLSENCLCYTETQDQFGKDTDLTRKFASLEQCAIFFELDDMEKIRAIADAVIASMK